MRMIWRFIYLYFSAKWQIEISFYILDKSEAQIMNIEIEIEIKIPWPTRSPDFTS